MPQVSDLVEGLAIARRELAEALERQAATDDVLRVIASSPGDLHPVFDAILSNATRLCGAKFGVLFRSERDALRAVALHDAPLAYAEERRRNPVIRPSPETLLGRALAAKQTLQIADIRDEWPSDQSASGTTGAQVAQLAGARTVVAVPMLKDNELVGAIVVYRQEVRPFTDRQIALLTNFANQAVIAIENTRLLNELRESLQQQTATADVLKVISRSTFDLQAVLDTLVESAARLCQADIAGIHRLIGSTYQYAASHGMTPDLDEFMRTVRFMPDRGTITGRTALEGKVVQIADVLKRTGLHSWRRGQENRCSHDARGPITARRDSNRRDRTDALSRAAVHREAGRASYHLCRSAVIAIENVRLFDEVQARTEELSESLQQQTATADVLKVISRTAFELQPIFDTLVENAVRLCEAERAFLFRFDGKLLRSAASYNVSPALREFVDKNPIAPGRHSISARAALERRTVHVPDIQDDPEYAYAVRDERPIRTMLAVPMLKGNDLVGTITIYRLELKPFTDKQIALVETFADQAAIAIENVRLFDEIQDKNRQLQQEREQIAVRLQHES